METNGYENSWRTVLKQLEPISGQSHDDLSVRTESVAFAQFFADTLGKNHFDIVAADEICSGILKSLDLFFVFFAR